MIMQYIALMLFLIAISSDIGFKFVHSLVQIQQWIEAHIMQPVLPYNWFWLLAFVIPLLILGVLFVIEVHKIRKALEK